MGLSQSYPAILEKKLKHHFPHKKIRVINAGETGASTDSLLADLPYLLNLHRPNMVISMMGINDHWALPKTPLSGAHLLLSHFKSYTLIKNLIVSLKNDRLISQRFKHHQKIHQLLRLKKLDPYHTEVTRNLAHLYFQAKNYEQARQEYELLFSLVATVKIGAKQNYFLSLLQLGQDQKASRFVENLIASAQKKDLLNLLHMIVYDGGTQMSKWWNIIAPKLPPTFIKTKEFALAKQKFLDRKQQTLSDFMPNSKTINIYDNPRTVANYLMLTKVLNKKKIVHVAMQYPNLPLMQLKNFLPNSPYLHLVDNFKTFHEGITKQGYSHYFEDHFAGNTGHLSQAGIQLLTDNILNQLHPLFAQKLSLPITAGSN